MAIEGFDKQSFIQQLISVVSASRPILSLEYLQGRTAELKRIEQALYAPGRNVFIFGERGVGKSSLAATAANQWQSSDAQYIDTSCSPDTKIYSLVSSIASMAVGRNLIEMQKRTKENKFEFKWLGPAFSHSDKTESLNIDFTDRIKHLSDAVEILREVAVVHSRTPVVVVDEVDRLDKSEVEKLADLLKQLGDKQVDLKFIFTGVGKSLDDILGHHQSAIRQLETIELPILSWNARWDIVIKALEKFNITIPRDIYIRIAGISQGYPYYVHLITEHLLWFIFDQPERIKEVTWDHYYNALEGAIRGISVELARPYTTVVSRRDQGYEEVLWATAVDQWQGAFLKDMYRQYLNIMTQLNESPHNQNQPTLSQSQFTYRVNKLQEPNFGQILVKGDRPNFFHYREKMLCGYIRMQAEFRRIKIWSEDEMEREKVYMRVPAKAPKTYGSTPPRKW